MSPKRLFFPIGLLLLLLVSPAPAQEAQEAPPQTVWHDFSTYLPLRIEGEEPAPALVAPEWIEEVLTEPAAEGVVHRIQIKPYGHYFEFLMARIYWQAGAAPVVVRGLDAEGTVLAELALEDPDNPGLLSGATAIPAVDVVTIEVLDPEYVVHGIYLAWLEGRLRYEPVDEVDLPTFINPHGIPNRPAPPTEDVAVNGVLTAMLSPSEPLQPDGDQQAVLFEFDLPVLPEKVMLICDVASPTLDFAPETYLNGQSIGPLEVQWPDLTDPAFEVGENRGLHGQDLYAGRTIARKMLPTHLVAPGRNELVIALPAPAASLHLRDVRLQLKFNWDPERAVQVGNP